jgi:hypothetical protein
MQPSGQVLDLAALFLGYETGYSLNRRSDGPQGQSGHFGQETIFLYFYVDTVKKNNNNKLQMGCHPVAVVIMHVHKYEIKIT